MSDTKKIKKPKRVKPPKTEEQDYLDKEVKEKKLKGAFLVTPAVNYLGRGSITYSSKVGWHKLKDKIKKDKK